MAKEAPVVLLYCWSQIAMPAVGGADGAGMVVGVVVVVVVVGGVAVVLDGAFVETEVGQSNVVVGGKVVQPQG